MRKLEAKPPHRVPGTAVFFTADPTAPPTSLMHNLKHNRVLHERNIILSIRTEDTPRVPRHERVTVDRINDTFIKVSRATASWKRRRSRKSSRSAAQGSQHRHRRHVVLPVAPLAAHAEVGNAALAGPLFIMLARSAQDATTYFQIPTDRVVEVGTQVAV